MEENLNNPLTVFPFIFIAPSYFKMNEEIFDELERSQPAGFEAGIDDLFDQLGPSK